MKKSEKTRNQLLFSVAFLTTLSVVIAGISFLLFQKIHEIYNMNTAVHKIYEHYTSATNSEENFLYKESKGMEFEGSDESFSNKSFKMHLKAIHLQLEELSKKQTFYALQIEQDISKLNSEISKYETLFTYASSKADEVGIDNIGTSMNLKRNEMELELKSAQIGLSNVLTLQKLEKDYLLENNSAYIHELEAKVESINADISQNKEYDFQQKIALIKLLHDFRYSFLDLVKSQRSIGFENEVELGDHLLKSKENINKLFVVIDKKLARKEIMLTSNIENILLIFIINIVTMTLFIIYIYTKKTSKDVFEKTYEEDDQKIFEIHNQSLAS